MLSELLWGVAIVTVGAIWWLTRRVKHRNRMEAEEKRAEHWRMHQHKHDRMPLRHAQGHPGHVPPRRTVQPLAPVPKTKVQSNEDRPVTVIPLVYDTPITTHSDHGSHTSHYHGGGGGFSGAGASGGWDSSSSSSSSSSSDSGSSSSSSSDSGSSSSGSSE